MENTAMVPAKGWDSLPRAGSKVSLQPRRTMISKAYGVRKEASWRKHSRENPLMEGFLG